MSKASRAPWRSVALGVLLSVALYACAIALLSAAVYRGMIGEEKIYAPLLFCVLLSAFVGGLAAARRTAPYGGVLSAAIFDLILLLACLGFGASVSARGTALFGVSLLGGFLGAAAGKKGGKRARRRIVKMTKK